MKKIKKFIVLAMATTMLLGATLTVNAAYCPHYPTSTNTYKYSTISGQCGHAMGCQFITRYYDSVIKCSHCGEILSSSEYTTVSHSKPF